MAQRRNKIPQSDSLEKKRVDVIVLSPSNAKVLQNKGIASQNIIVLRNDVFIFPLQDETILLLLLHTFKLKYDNNFDNYKSEWNANETWCLIVISLITVTEDHWLHYV